MLTAVDARRRWFGSFFLILAVGFLLWGLTIFKGFLVERPTAFVVYWLSCFALTALSLGIAVYDLFVMRRRIRTEKRAAFERAFKEVPGNEDQ